MRFTVLSFALTVLAAILVAPSAASAATCSDYPNQAAAQRAHDTRDADHDGIYCESLPCPCSTAKPHRHSHKCKKPRHLVRLSFSGTKYPTIRQHFLDALKAGWPKVLVLNRRGAAARRKKLLSHYATKTGYDRDEYPPAVGRGRGKGLTRGRHPRGWKADVAYVPSHENRSQGASLGLKLRRFCNGTKFRYVFY